MWGCRLVSSGSGENPALGSCEHGNELSVIIPSLEFVLKRANYRLITADCAPCTYIYIQALYRCGQFSCYSGTLWHPKFGAGLILREIFLGSFNRIATFSYIIGWQEGFNVRPQQLLEVSKCCIGHNFQYSAQILIQNLLRMEQKWQ